MYIGDDRYGQSKKRGWLIISICILMLGLSGITIRVMAGQAEKEQENVELQGAEFKSTTMILLNEQVQERIVEGISSGSNLLSNVKTMYLTFDDGPTPENTEKILDILKEKDIRATFFVVGENVRKNPEIAKRIVAEGHTIGIHCNWHDYDDLYESVDSYVADFEKAYQTVYEVTGEKVTLFRFPGGSINAYNKNVYQDIIEEMTNRGFIYYDWNASLEDAVSKEPSPETLIQNAKESTLGRKKIIMLAHDTVDNTVLCLEELIEQFSEYKMKPLTPEVEPIQF